MATAKRRKAAVTELRLAIAPNTQFDEIVAILKQALTVPELPGLKGCRPCLSGLDRFIIEDIVQRGMR